MWRSRTAMPVSSVCRSMRSAPLTLPGSAALAVTSPLTLLVRASKLPPTVSGHTTTTSAPLTLYASAARDEPATPTTPTTPRTTALRTMDIGGSWLLNALDRELDGEGARACGRDAGERLAHVHDDRQVVGDARLHAGRQPIEVRLLRGVDNEVFRRDRRDEPLHRGEEHLRVPGEVLRPRLRRRLVARRPRGEVVLREHAPFAEAEARVRAGARAVERRRLREARRHADDRAVLPHVDARDDAAAVLPLGRRLFAAGAEHVRREPQPVRVPMRLQP